MSIQGTAHYVRKDISGPLKPFTEQGFNTSYTEERLITARRIEIGYDGMKTQGFATTSLRHYLHGSIEDDNQLRQDLMCFWKSQEGRSLLRSRFGSSNLQVFPTHVTRRRAPPDQLNLVHIDYPAQHNVQSLYQEWSSRWNAILPPNFVDSYMLHGVLTVWIALSSVTNFPLLVADASTASDTVIYSVGKRSSVGVYHDDNIQWYTVPEMKPFDAWIFDTQCNPHVAIDLQSKGCRTSVEVRCLIASPATRKLKKLRQGC